MMMKSVIANASSCSGMLEPSHNVSVQRDLSLNRSLVQTAVLQRLRPSRQALALEVLEHLDALVDEVSK